MCYTTIAVPFTVEDFQDLVRLLEEKPEWRAPLRRLVLSEELLELPGQLEKLKAESYQRLLETQQVMEQKFAELAEALSELSRVSDQRLGHLESDAAVLKDGVSTLKSDTGILKDDVKTLKSDTGILKDDVKTLKSDVGVLKDDVKTLKNDVGVLKDDVKTLKSDVGILKDDVKTLKNDMGEAKDDVKTLKNDMGEVKGESLERKYSDRAAAYLARLASRVRPLSSPELADLIEIAREEGRLTQAQGEQLLVCDVVARGRSRQDGSEIYLVAEVSWGIGPGDVERAWTRAGLLQGVTGVPSWPVVAGKSITGEARELARQRGVWMVVEREPVEGPGTAA
ncbi:MAG: hypothetical protein HY319_27340 [Armatimonadetes bacterium]|nr:hypothetical protein [Armatimonadota bacterium]